MKKYNNYLTPTYFQLVPGLVCDIHDMSNISTTDINDDNYWDKKDMILTEAFIISILKLSIAKSNKTEDIYCYLQKTIRIGNG